MRRLLVFLFLSTRAFGAFSYYRTLTIDHTKCGVSDSSNFPVLVSISHGTLKTVGNGGHIGHTTNQSSPAVTMPADLIFSADSAGATKYPWEVASYDGANGILIAWVRIPAVSHTTDTVFYLLYGDSAVSTAQNTGPLAPSNVWDSSYKMVLHMGDGSTLSTADSTGLNTETSHSATASSGKIGGGAAFDGSQSIIFPNSSALLLGSTMSFEAWVRKDDTTNHLSWFDKRAAGGHGYYSGFNGSVYAVEAYLSGTTTSKDNYWLPGGISGGVFHHVVWTYDGSVFAAYVDGSSVGSFSIAIGSTDDNSASFYLGRSWTNTYLFNGVLDEFRISNVARPTDWILTSYNNQNAPGNIGADNFLKYGAESTPPPPAGGTIRHRVMGGE